MAEGRSFWDVDFPLKKMNEFFVIPVLGLVIHKPPKHRLVGVNAAHVTCERLVVVLTESGALREDVRITVQERFRCAVKLALGGGCCYSFRSKLGL